jgi:hypothetical protein
VQHTGSEGTGPVVTEIRYRWADPADQADAQPARGSGMSGSADGTSPEFSYRRRVGAGSWDEQASVWRERASGCLRRGLCRA